MRIEELLAESQNLEEGPGWDTAKQGFKQMGQGVGNVAKGAVQGAPGVVGKTVGGVAKGLGAVAGGIAGAFNQAKAGFNAGKAAVGGSANGTLGNQQQQQTPNATQTNTSQGTNQTTQSDTQTTPQVNAPVANPAAAAQADQQAKIGIKQINGIIPTLKTAQLKSIQNTINTRMQALNKNPTGAAAPTNAQTATGTQQPQGNQQVTKANTVATPQQQQNVGKYSGQPLNVTAGNPLAMAESKEFYSKFLGKNI